MPDRKGRYGFDAPRVPTIMGVAGLVSLTIALAARSSGSFAGLVLPASFAAVSLLLSVVSYVYTTRRGKFEVWARLLRSLRLRGDEHVVDLGCGRGAVLMLAAKLLPQGQVVGVDVWKPSDQSGNDVEETRRNAELEGVAERVQLETADVRELPFEDASFELAVSSLAIHNIPSAEGRAAAIDEAVRVLKPGGRLAIADIRFASDYARRLRKLGLSDVKQKNLGPRFWYGGPWMATKLVSAVKPR